jgi:hypothetical protein
MKCKECEKEIEESLQYLAYYSDGKPVFWQKCEECIKKSWIGFRNKLTSILK